MNPIWKREFFARWRDWRSHLLLFGLALVLGALAFWSYKNAIEYQPTTYQMSMGMGRPVYTYMTDPNTGQSVVYVPESLATRASRTGRALFVALALGNVAVWFVLAPMLTATGVARERERGLLESLQLSRMSPRSQIWARACSAMLYLLALQMVTLPIYFVAFSFGGVSPEEIGRVWLLVAGAAWCGVGLGLAISSASSRPSGALFGAVALIGAWSLLSWLGFGGAQSPYGFLGLASGTTASPLTFCQMLFYCHPIGLMQQLLDPTTLRPPNLNGPLAPVVTMMTVGGKKTTTMMPTPFTPVFWTAFQVFPFALLAWFLVGSAGLFRAARDVTRAFAPSGWAGRNPLVEHLKRRRQARLESQREKARMGVEGALLADLPFDKWIHFKNPLLNREVKGRFRLRRASVPMWAGRIVLFLFAASGWLLAMAALFDPIGRASGASVVLWMEWILGVLLVGTFAASGFAREREAGTWEGVRLSLLSNAEIARTKWASPLIAFALLTLPLWGLLWAFVPVGGGSGVPFHVLLAGGVVVAASLAFVSALASWVSLRARNTTTATCWTLGSLLLLLYMAPLAWSVFGVDTWSARQITGVSPSDTRRNFYNTTDYAWRNSPETAERYKLETGRTAPFQTGSGVQGDVSPANVERYQAWCEEKQKQFSRVSTLVGAWNPLFVLSEAGRARQRDDIRFEDNDFVGMALGHSLLCAAAAALLLGGVTRRLKRQVE